MLRSVARPDARPRSVPRALLIEAGRDPLRRHGAVALDDPGTEHLDRRVLRQVDRQPAAAASQPGSWVHGMAPASSPDSVSFTVNRRSRSGASSPKKTKTFFPTLATDSPPPGWSPGLGEAQRERQKLGLQRIHRSTRIRALHRGPMAPRAKEQRVDLVDDRLRLADDVPPRMKMRDGLRRRTPATPWLGATGRGRQQHRPADSPDSPPARASGKFVPFATKAVSEVGRAELRDGRCRLVAVGLPRQARHGPSRERVERRGDARGNGALPAEHHDLLRLQPRRSCDVAAGIAFCWTSSSGPPNTDDAGAPARASGSSARSQ